MSPEQPLAWPRPELGEVASGAPVSGGAAGKNRSRDEPAGGPRHADASGHAAPTAARAPQTRVVREYVPQAAAWSTRIVRSEAEFEALREGWAALLAESDHATVFMSHEWLFAWWSAYRPDADLAIVVAEDRGRVRGIAPMMIVTVRRAGVTARVLRFIGDGTGETDHVDFVTAGADRAESAPALLDAIARLDWDIAEFNQVPETAASVRALTAWIERSGLPREVETSPCPVRRLPPTFEDLLATLPSRLRTSLRSSRRKLAAAHRVDFGLHTDPDELAEALQRFFENHESRWQGKGIAGAFSNPRRREFYARLTPRLLERGWLRFFYLKLDGRPVAQQYCFALDGTVMLLQEGFDFDRAQDNVGNVLRSHVFEHLIQSGATCYDFLAGSSRHKQSWSDGVVHDLRIRCARRSPKGWLFFTVPRWTKQAKDALRPWRDRLLARRAETHG